MNFYNAELLEHYKNPRNYGKLDLSNFNSGEDIPSCGDSIEIYGLIEQGIIQNLSFTGNGCIISQACASILMQNSSGKSVQEIINLDEKMILGLLNISLGPNRKKCALLSFNALKNGLKKIINNA